MRSGALARTWPQTAQLSLPSSVNEPADHHGCSRGQADSSKPGLLPEDPAPLANSLRGCWASLPGSPSGGRKGVAPGTRP